MNFKSSSVLFMSTSIWFSTAIFFLTRFSFLVYQLDIMQVSTCTSMLWIDKWQLLWFLHISNRSNRIQTTQLSMVHEQKRQIYMHPSKRWMEPQTKRAKMHREISNRQAQWKYYRRNLSRWSGQLSEPLLS